MSPTPTTQCPTCGEPLSTDEIFCNHCFTMNPMVREFLKNNPKQHSKDYMTVDSTCPYCSKRQSNRVIDEFLTTRICTPIQRCKKCGGYFVQTKGLEWCVAPSSFRSQKRLLTDLLIKNEYNIIEPKYTYHCPSCSSSFRVALYLARFSGNFFLFIYSSVRWSISSRFISKPFCC